MKIPDVAFETIEVVTSGTFKSVAGETHPALPPFCRVVGRATPRPASSIGFEVWLPLEKWNGRYVQVGNGGLAGVIFYLELADMLRRGYATAATDNGHVASPVDGRWAIGQPEKVADFGYRAVHETRGIAGGITERFFGKAPKRHYFYGCSQGGREAHVEAQRFPEDFDGIVAGSPANDWISLLSGFVWASQAVHGKPESFIPEAKLPTIQKAAIAACDRHDGVADGQIGRPSACRFDPAVLQCSGADSSECLTAPQVEALKKVYGGLKDPASGQVISPGYAAGAEAELSPLGGGLRSYVFGAAPGQSLDILFAMGFFGGMVFEDPAWDWKKFDFTRDVKIARDKLGAVLDATNPDMSGFAGRGGKFLQYHGWFDGSVPPEASTGFYEKVAARMGGVGKTADFYRLFMAPGMLHCGWGPGPNVIGALGVPAPQDPEHDVLLALQRWVEEGVAPEQIIATKYVGDDPSKGVARTQPLCPWPKQAAWDGKGNPDSADSYACK